MYSDCWVEDSRLVVLNAMDARERGATVLTRTGVVSARREGEGWVATLREERGGAERTIRARAVVNAAGPWVSATLGGTLGINSRAAVRLIKGSHIVVKRLFDGDQAYILQQPDKRIIFAIPYESDFTLIGTTDVPYDGEPGPVSISAEETDYLCGCINRSFDTKISPADVVWSYSGVRPLYDDAAENASAVTRDYVLDVEDQGGKAAVLSVFGGKITTYRRLAEHALEKLKPYFPHLKNAWTGDAVLPGGAMKDSDFDQFLAKFRAEKPFLLEETARRLARAYGTRARDIVGTARSVADLGETFDGGLTAAEVEYLRGEEWAGHRRGHPVAALEARPAHEPGECGAACRLPRPQGRGGLTISDPLRRRPVGHNRGGNDEPLRRGHRPGHHQQPLHRVQPGGQRDRAGPGRARTDLPGSRPCRARRHRDLDEDPSRNARGFGEGWPPALRPRGDRHHQPA